MVRLYTFHSNALVGLEACKLCFWSSIPHSAGYLIPPSSDINCPLCYVASPFYLKKGKTRSTSFTVQVKKLYTGVRTRNNFCKRKNEGRKVQWSIMWRKGRGKLLVGDNFLTKIVIVPKRREREKKFSKESLMHGNRIIELGKGEK